MRKPLPAWVDISIMPLINIAAAFVVAGIIIALIGENPFTALAVMIKGAFVYKGALGYTLYYTTNFIFTGLAVAVAFHAMLFNIGGEGQAMIGGLGIGFIVLSLDPILPPLLVILLAIPVAAIFGAIWGVIPGWLQARRGSHIVITTIMFNFIASSIMVWLLAGMLMAPGQMSPETRHFADGVSLMQIHHIGNALGWPMARSPLNLSFVIALIAGGGGMGADLANAAWLYHPGDRP
jgi:simple sugar transport system permease protein